jgi:hypothetical protein
MFLSVLICPLRSEQNLPFLITHLSLQPSSASRTPPSSAQGVLCGGLVSSVNRLRDQYGRPGIFFVFPDVSVRQRGVFSLCATMVNVMRYVVHVSV